MLQAMKDNKARHINERFLKVYKAIEAMKEYLSGSCHGVSAEVIWYHENLKSALRTYISRSIWTERLFFGLVAFSSAPCELDSLVCDSQLGGCMA